MGTYEEIREELLDVIDSVINKIILSSSIIALLNGIIILIFQPTNIYAGVMDIVFSVAVFLIFLFKDKISTLHRVTLSVVLFLLFIVSIIYFTGITGSGPILITILFVIAYVFLPARIYKPVKYSVFAILLILVYIRIDHADLFSHHATNTFSQWLFIYIGLFIYVYMLEVSLRLLINYLTRTNESLRNTIFELQDKESEIERLAYYDSLTDLPNRELFSLNVNEFIKNGEHGVLVVLNLTKMTQINSMYGEHVGDKVLLEVARSLNKVMTSPSRICRIYGNEFAVFAKIENKEKIEKTLAKFISKLKNNDMLHEYQHYLEWRVGASDSINDGKTFDELIHKANVCLRYAKENQILNQVVYFSRDIQFDFEKNDVLLKEIETGIMNYTFEIFVQEKVNTVSEKVVGLEALARFQSPLLGPVSPGIFIPVIEDHDKAIPFGEMIFEKALQLIPHIDDKYGEIPLSINISPNHMKSTGFVQYISDRLEKYNVDPARIEIEITENVLLDDFEYTYYLIKRIQDIGLKVSLDDFGTGFSSLQYLIDLPVDIIKIDRAFIRNVHTDEKQRVLVKSILNISSVNGYEVVAEGVEELEQVEVLKELGCDVVQGYYYSKPSKIKNA